jgi:ABC-2 type transport system ATP-binding protein
MSELEDTADRLVVIGRGRLIAVTGVAELLASASGDRVRLRTPRVPEVMRLLAAAGGTVTTDGPNMLTVTGLDAASVAELTAARGLPLHELTPQRATLEQAFMQLTRDAVEFGDQRVS